ncbi:hypothetical protein C7N43_13525 [Sphingobacteriales bacterium UPWRP_1]|nr:hypothetical protein BVG80_11495 [Sphingobacteriales bacterium TSM_CSM]PSJ76468.1 hypothetical protein C7N43_13525 [Sphingobacteriales bacterium UPWRP_1]
MAYLPLRLLKCKRHTLSLRHFWCCFCCLLFLQGAPALYAQILQRDSIMADSRYRDIYFTSDRYALSPFQHPDTGLFWFPFYSPIQQPGAGGRQIGNNGQAAFSQLFTYNKQIGFHSGFRQFDQYALTRDSVLYYAGKYPYAQLKYTIGGQEEQSARIAFAQAITPNLRYFFNYRMLNSPGAFRRQRANHQNLSASVWYKTANSRYNALAYFLNNAATVQQNGGVLAEQLRLGDTINVILDELLLPRSNVVPVQLANAENRQRSNEMLLQQTYDWGTYFTQQVNDTLQVKTLFPVFRIGHAFSTGKEKNVYKDSQPPVSGFYPDFFISRSKTADSLSTQQFTNEFFVSWFGKKTAPDSAAYLRTTTMRAGFTHQLIRVNRFITQDTIPIQTITLGNNNTYTTNRDTIYRVIEHKDPLNSGTLTFLFQSNPHNRFLQYNAQAKYALFGFNLADFWVNTNVRLQISPKVGGIKGRLIASRLTPDYINEFYFSNHFRWQNNFNKINALQLWATYFNTALNLETGYANHTFTNYIVWNEAAQPQQLPDAINISQFYLQHHAAWKGLHLHTWAALQFSGTDKVQLPLLNYQNLFYWRKNLFRNALTAELGFLFYLNTAYFANAYAPATGQFYLQNTEKIDWYPVADVYGVFKVKRVRLFVKMEHVNQGLLKRKSYFTAPHYPGIDRVFRFGASWMFYD